MTRCNAVEYGIALGLVVGLVILVSPTGPNDYSAIFWTAGRVVDPYDQSVYQGLGLFAYPIWNVVVLRFAALFPVRVGLACVYLVSVLAALVLAPRWGTPAWLVLLSPVFFKALIHAQPFEAFVFAGLTLIVIGRPGLGLCLLAFKPQIGFAPALLVILRKPRAALLPMVMALGATVGELFLTGRLWVFPWLQALRHIPGVYWNDSLWGGLGIFSLLWIPMGLWLLDGDLRRELWVATAIGILCMPYWTSASLWPLVAMVGCWRSKHDSH